MLFSETDHKMSPILLNAPPTSIHTVQQWPMCPWQARHADRDERRHLSKLALVRDVKCEQELREVTQRFDLEPGTYFLVPYTLKGSQEGEYLVRVLGQKDEVTSKNAWYVNNVTS